MEAQGGGVGLQAHSRPAGFLCVGSCLEDLDLDIGKPHLGVARGTGLAAADRLRSGVPVLEASSQGFGWAEMWKKLHGKFEDGRSSVEKEVIVLNPEDRLQILGKSDGWPSRPP